MKRHVWVSLAVVPLLLLGATLWARKVAWERMENEFRQGILTDATRNSDCSFVVSAERNLWATELATWTPAQLKAALSDIHLQKASSLTSRAVVNNATWLRFEAFAGEPEPVSGFYIQIEGGYGSIGGARASQQFNGKWSQFELTPASRQALEHRIQEQYGDKLCAMPTAPPK